MQASKLGKTDSVKKLLECGAQIDHQDLWGCTAAMFAAEHGHADTLELLVKHGANTHLKGSEGMNVISFSTGLPKLLDVLITTQLEVDLSGNTPNGMEVGEL